MSEKDLFEEGLGNVTWWGFSPAEEATQSMLQGKEGEHLRALGVSFFALITGFSRYAKSVAAN